MVTVAKEVAQCVEFCEETRAIGVLKLESERMLRAKTQYIMLMETQRALMRKTNCIIVKHAAVKRSLEIYGISTDSIEGTRNKLINI
jgi:hypothetical protein